MTWINDHVAAIMTLWIGVVAGFVENQTRVGVLAVRAQATARSLVMKRASISEMSVASSGVVWPPSSDRASIREQIAIHRADSATISLLAGWPRSYRA